MDIGEESEEYLSSSAHPSSSSKDIDGAPVARVREPDEMEIEDDDDAVNKRDDDEEEEAAFSSSNDETASTSQSSTSAVNAAAAMAKNTAAAAVAASATVGLSKHEDDWMMLEPNHESEAQRLLEEIKSEFKEELDFWDTTMVSEYSEEIFAYMAELEVRRSSLF